MPRHKHVVATDLPDLDRKDIEGNGKGPWLRANLTALILSMSPGDLFPSERVLAERYGVARMTVSREMASLANSGLLERVPGRGTFVRRPSGMVETLSSFTDLRTWYHATARIISVRTVRPTRHERATLGLGPEEDVVALHRVRLTEGRPMAVERVKLPARRFPGLNRRGLEGRSLYGVLASEYDTHAYSAEQTITVSRLDARDAELLEVEEGSPAMRIDRITHDNLGAVMDMSTALCHPDRYSVQIHIGLG
ncbi:GntR family transcriptional regulator [Actinopolymorpha rutila]|uniref:GntR family transcriptional regulator n=1 Tax=Actinopolymorpha rutila TaxID=446787 RepID=A0A852ZMP3_9ACTN|nr:GntR family transcriptional regulator [Actinopolymorpha rutila]NYH90749.1 GntR family transcriptional regulator [Actinopolymorpha rutila]